MDRRSSSFFARTALVVTVVLGFGAMTVTPNKYEPQGSTSTSYIAGSEPAGARADTSPRVDTAQDVPVEEAILQETSTGLAYTGEWSTAAHSAYLGGQATWSTQKGATARVTFNGVGISWIGPVGPTRGKARIYVDDRYVKTVDTYAAQFDPSRVLFSTTYTTEKPRTLKVVVFGTRGHPMVAIDALVVRTLARAAAEPPPVPATNPTPAPTTTPTPAGASSPTPTPAATPRPTATPLPTPLASPTPSSVALPTPAPPTGSSVGSSVKVTTIPALLTALANNAITDIVVANGTYRVSPAGGQRTDSLWIAGRYASRTNPVTVRAETRGGVTFDGGGATSFGGLAFEAGAHHQTWDGFTFANGAATNTGVVMFGGFAGLAAPHHITLRNITFLGSCTGRATGATGNATDHAIYVAHSVGGAHDLLFEDINVDGSGYLASAMHFYHSDSANVNAWNVTVRRLTVNRTQQAIILWDATIENVTIDGATITNALYAAVRYERPGEGIALRNITSTGSGHHGFYSSLGSSPPGVTFYGNSFN